MKMRQMGFLCSDWRHLQSLCTDFVSLLLSLEGIGLWALGSPAFSSALLLLVPFGSPNFVEAASILLKSSFSLPFILSQYLATCGLCRGIIFFETRLHPSAPSTSPAELVLPKDGLPRAASPQLRHRGCVLLLSNFCKFFHFKHL